MKRNLILAVVLVLLASCKKEMISDSADQNDLKKYAEISSNALLMKAKEELGQSSKSNPKQVSRPFKGKGSGAISYIPNGCGDGTLQFRSEGTGNSTHLGLQEQITTFCIDMATGAPIGPIVGVGTAANGDKLFYSLIGAGTDAATGLMFQEYAFSGGTGKFTDASGNLTLLYTVNTPTNYEYTATGTIIF